MQISHAVSPREMLIALDGDLDHHNAHAVITYIQRLAILNPGHPITLDFARVNFMDSSGIAVIVNANRSVGRSNLTIRHVPTQPMRIFHAAGLDRRIKFE